MVDYSSLAWSPWYPLEQVWRKATIPAVAGLYKIRRTGRDDLDYIGQTGSGTMQLRRRLAMLSGVFQENMPYRAPHTAGPALWALRHATGCSFEVSVVPVAGSTPWRKGLEALAIALYRQQFGQSPTVNFGRMPVGYQMSSDNNARLQTAGKVFRGGPTTEAQLHHLPGLAPMGSLLGEPTSADWGEHAWSVWLPINQAFDLLQTNANGLYRLRISDEPTLLYIGEGIVRSRLAAHLQKTRQPEHRQAALFGTEHLECAWVLNDTWHHHQRLELENDLIAARLLATGSVPAAQFLG